LAAPATIPPAATALAALRAAGAGGPHVVIATGGSSRQPAWIVHNAHTLGAAVAAYCACFAASETHACVLLLPTCHVGGLLAALRAACRGGNMVWADWHNWKSTPPAAAALAGYTLSLVPAQLAMLLEQPAHVAALRRARRILIGGAALPAALATAARAAGLPLAPCYGMTETAALVTLTRADDFLAGDASCGRPIPGVGITIAPGEGRISVSGPQVALGRLGTTGLVAFPASAAGRTCATADHGQWLPDGRLQVHGRLDRTVISGGRKIDADMVERRILAHPQVCEAAVAGIPDPAWGERLCAWYAGTATDAELAAWCHAGLAAHEVPRTLQRLPSLPRTPAGKIDWPALI
jgi:O-succinylbenzoic acid--CoA ligase